MAIKAHLDHSATTPDTRPEGQRAAPRRALWLETSGFFADAGPDGVEANVTIHNISAAGLLLETGIALTEG